MLEIEALAREGLGPIDFTLSAGECVAVVGPSGAGKSLLLRAIADLDPNTGRVCLDGVIREHMPAPAWRKQVAYLPAESGWWADRVGDHFADEEALRSRLPVLGLTGEAMAWPVARLSSGERQRLALLRLLEGEPRVLLLDEPTAALDEESKQQVEALLGASLAGGCAVLIATHDQAQAERLARRRLAIAGGRFGSDGAWTT